MIWTFFYGSWINLNILKEKDFFPDHYEVARLHGFDIAIQPLANIFPSESRMVYGILLATSREKHHRMLAALTTAGAMGTVYLPQAVLVETCEGKWMPALCYTSSGAEKKPASADYIAPFIKSAKEWGFPEWYVKHLERFFR